MSKEKPEVGDVWASNTNEVILYHITAIDNGVVRAWQSVFSQVLQEVVIDNDVINKYFVYLGKSKASIDDLFKTDNEERCIEDNMPHNESTVLFKDLENEK